MANLITEKSFKFEISEKRKKERIDSFLTNSIENATRSKIQKLIKAEYVKVNSQSVKPNYILRSGDVVEVIIPVSPRPEKAEPEEIPLEIIYEDEYLIIVNKPAGLVVHPALGNYTGTLVNALLHHTQSLSNPDETNRPGIVHRLDKETSGLMLVAKDDWTHAQLAKQFSSRTISREYWAVCWGIFDKKEGEIIANIARSKKDRKLFSVSEHEGKHAHTLYKVIEEFEFCSLLSLKLQTGRTHQIRVHLSSINHPVFGDPTYGGRKIVYGSSLPKMKNRIDNLLNTMQRQALHAKKLTFFHPHKKETLTFDSQLPEDITELIANLAN